jgi:hypothetical protein
VSRLANDGEPALSSSSVPSGNGRARFYVSTTRGRPWRSRVMLHPSAGQQDVLQRAFAHEQSLDAQR